MLPMQQHTAIPSEYSSCKFLIQWICCLVHNMGGFRLIVSDIALMALDNFFKFTYKNLKEKNNAHSTDLQILVCDD